jgi:Ca-activated chloride channel homolog
VSAFPALEQDVVSYNKDNPRLPLTAVYPSDGSADADFPYLVLNWSHANTQQIDPARQQRHDDVARAFLKYLQGPAGRKAFMDQGYRDANRRPGLDVNPTYGAARTVPTMPRPVMSSELVSQTVSMWTAISRPTNLLLVVDVSANMGQQVPGTGGETKLQLVAKATSNAINLFGPHADIGLWGYASQLDGRNDYEQLVPLGNINRNYDGLTRRVGISNALAELTAGGRPGLYATTSAAYAMMRKHYMADASNQIVIITGTGEDSGSGSGLSGLVSELGKSQDKTHPLPVVTVGYGDSNQLDLSALQTISQASGGRTYTAHSPSEISNVLLTALFSGTPPPSS